MNTKKNQATFDVYVSDKSTVYYAYAYMHSPLPTADEIISQTYEFGLGYGSSSTYVSY